MPLPLYRRRASSPWSKDSPKPSTEGPLYVEKTGRKSSLTASLQSLAKSTFHSKTRRSDAGKAAATTKVSTSPTPALESTSSPLKSKRSFFSKRLSSGSASSVSSQATVVPHVESPVPPVPRVPSISNRKFVSRIPTPVRSVGSVGTQSTMASKENNSSISPDKKPFVGYRDVKSLSAVDKGKGKAKEEYMGIGKERNQTTYGHVSSRNSSPNVALGKGQYNSSIPLPKSSSSLALLGSSRRATVLPPVTTCSPVHGHTQATTSQRVGPRRSENSGARQQSPRTMPKKQGGYSSRSSASPAERTKSRHCITSQQQRLQRPTAVLPKSMTAGNLANEQQTSSKASLLTPIAPNTQPAQPRKTENNARRVTQRENKENIDAMKLLEEQIPPKIQEGDLGQDDPRLVKTAQPQQYWLGRFTTLMSSFQFEAAFNEPDPATGYGVAGNRLEGGANLDDYHTKRAFMVLERMCVTPEAVSSFAEFREAYSRRFGRRFSDRFGGNIDAQVKKSSKPKTKPSKVRPVTQVENRDENQGKKEGNGEEELGVKQIFKSVRKSFA